LDRWTLVDYSPGSSPATGRGVAIRAGIGPDNLAHFYASTNAMVTNTQGWTAVLSNTAGEASYTSSSFFVSGRDHAFGVSVSEDGYQWKNCGVQPYFIDQITRVRGGFLGRGVPYPAAPYQELLYQSSDGCQWQPSALPYVTYSGLKLTAFGNGVLMGTIFDGLKGSTDIYLSDDFATWTISTNALPDNYGFAFVHGEFLAIQPEWQAGRWYGVLRRSRDGHRWSDKVRFGPTPGDSNPWAVLYANRTYLAFGGRYVYSSNDAISWTTHDTALSFHFSAYAFGGFWAGRFLLVPLVGGTTLFFVLSDVVPPAVDQVRLLPDLCRRLPDGGMLLTVEAPYGRAVTVEASGDLAVWSPIATDSCDTGEFEVYDERAKTLDHRFYRAWQAGP
jgi:hypothetical protein